MLGARYGRRNILQGGVAVSGLAALNAGTQVLARDPATGSSYESAGYNENAKIGFGRKLGLVVVDFQRAFTDPVFPSGRSDHIQRAVQNTSKLALVAREAGVPIAQSYSAYSSERDMPFWKVGTKESRAAAFGVSSEGSQLDARVYDPSYDSVFWKRAPSIFFGTSAASFFIREQVDTLIVTGCTTSGCIRATVVDAFSYGFRVMVPEACCGDQEQDAHEANLKDMGRRYADVVAVEECIEAIRATQQA